MGFMLVDVLAMSIVFAAIIAAVRYRRINRIHYPFLYLCWMAFITEVITIVMVYSGHYSTIPYTIFTIIEPLLFTWWLFRIGLFRKGNFFPYIVAGLVICWIVQVEFISGLSQNMTYFRLLYGFFLLICGAVLLAREAATQRDPLWRSPIFLISIGMVIFYSMVIVLGVFDIYGVQATLSQQMQGIMSFINAFVNIIYAIAILCMTRHLRFTLPL